MDRRQVFAVSIGGALGATTRWAVITAAGPPTGFPWVVFAINVVGSAVLGAALAEQMHTPTRMLLLHDGLGIGFCGGLTTFSTFAVEVAGFLRTDRPGLAFVYLLASVGAGIVAAMLGAAVLHQVNALALPLEEEP